ncbi:MAG: PEP-CTERM sorting domain-containing protein [Pseudomonadota bacterium]|nr:PEP-CTERM sorting domain-containing protein [Pseudomonadota bacterium]
MNFKEAAIVAATLLASAPGALAHASATIDFAGIKLTQNGSGTNFAGTFFGTTLAAGQSISQQFNYTVQIVDNGLAADRAWSTCLPLSLIDCGPAATGFEQVQVELQAFRDGREANPFIDFTGGPSQTVFDGISGQTATFSGTFTLTETNTDQFGQWGDTELLFAALWVDSHDMAPVPEPTALAAMLAGLALVGRRLRKRPRDAISSWQVEPTTA